MENPVSESAYWAERYAADDAGWDLGGPCPVFVDLLDSERAPPPGRVAFPGCGAGHDVRLFLDRGYDAVGFDFAIAPEGLPIERLDVFELGRRYPASFDAVIEYTCYCAIDPGRRREYVDNVRAILRPGGLVVALLFPVGEREGGPPYAVAEREIEEVWARDLELLSVETPSRSVESRRGMERLAILQA